MAKTIQCDIVSVESKIFSGKVQMVVAAGIMGDLGITPGHTPLLTPLQPGPVRVKPDDDEEQQFYISGGYLEVQPNVVTILADSAVRASDIDEAAAEEAKKQALEAIQDQQGEMEVSVAMAQLAEAAARLRTLQQLKNTSNRK